jgi:hypothetical protein
VDDRDGHAGIESRRHQPLPVGGGEGERLLAQDRATGSDRAEPELDPGGRRRGQVDDVDVGAVDELLGSLEARVGAEAQSIADLGATLRERIGDRHDLRQLGDCLERRQVMPDADVAEPDEPDPDRGPARPP